MADHVLTIQRVLSDGAIAKTITCRSGRIAVLRGNAPEKLYEYELALRGLHENENAFRISFDGKVYEPSQHLFVGFENIRFETDITTAQLLHHFGLSDEEIKTSLLAHGLSQVAEIPVSRLTVEEAHCVALLKASYEPHPLTVLNDPFIKVPESSREMFAQTIATSVWKNKTIIIVTSLSWRPDHWIDNDLITRVQVDQTARRATVGIGAENPLTELAKQLRKEKRSIVQKQEEKKLIEQKKNSVLEQIRAKLPPLPNIQAPTSALRLPALLGALLITAWFIAGDVVVSKLAQLTKDSPSRAQASLKPTNLPANSSDTPLLDTYPVDIRDAALSAFYGETTSRGIPSRAVPVESFEQKEMIEPTVERAPEQREIQPRSTIERMNPSVRAPVRSFERSPVENSNGSDRPPLPPEVEERMRRMMEGKDPAVQERIENMMRRMHDPSSRYGGR